MHHVFFRLRLFSKLSTHREVENYFSSVFEYLVLRGLLLVYLTFFTRGFFLVGLYISNFFGGIVNVSAAPYMTYRDIGTYPPGGEGGDPLTRFARVVKCQMMSASVCQMMSPFTCHMTSQPQRSFSGEARTEPVLIALPEHAIGDGVEVGRGQEVAGSVPTRPASLVGGSGGKSKAVSDAGAGFSERATGHGISLGHLQYSR